VSVRAPAGLSTRARRLWREVASGWDLDPDERVVLEEACRALTRVEQLEERVTADGPVTAGSKGQPREHPLLPAIDRERRAVLVALKQLGLDREVEQVQGRDSRGRFGDLRGRYAKGQQPKVVPIRRDA
jgi:P27 family predicted phage terminase small subunit